MDDALKPRRSKTEEEAEIEDHFARVREERQDPPLYELVQQLEADEEAAFQQREQMETGWEKAESERIKRVEAEIEAERPYLRQRELRRTFSKPPNPERQAA